MIAVGHWVWSGDPAYAAWGHHDLQEFTEACVRQAAEDWGAEEAEHARECYEATRVFVVRDPSRDGQGDADEAYRLAREGERGLELTLWHT